MLKQSTILDLPEHKKVTLQLPLDCYERLMKHLYWIEFKEKDPELMAALENRIKENDSEY